MPTYLVDEAMRRIRGVVDRQHVAIAYPVVPEAEHLYLISKL